MCRCNLALLGPDWLMVVNRKSIRVEKLLFLVEFLLVVKSTESGNHQGDFPGDL